MSATIVSAQFESLCRRRGREEKVLKAKGEEVRTGQ